MKRFILKRLLVSIPVLIGITLIIFFLLNVVPGDPVALMMKEHISVDVVARVRAQMHLDDPAIVRYFRFLGNALRGDLGESYKLNRPVTSLILHAFPNTFVLAIWALVEAASCEALACLALSAAAVLDVLASVLACSAASAD